MSLFKDGLFSLKSNGKPWYAAFKFLVILVIIDQITKMTMYNWFQPGDEFTGKGLMYIFPVLNEGNNAILEALMPVGFYGLAITWTILLSVMAIVWQQAIVKGCRNPLYYFGLAAMMSGGISNGIDRLYLPGSIDWLTLAVSSDLHLGINLTDVAIPLGLFSILISVMMQIRVELRLRSNPPLLD